MTRLTVTKALLLATAVLCPTARADTCTTVESQTTSEILRPLTLGYKQEQTEYWSTACSALKPSCIIAPHTTEEVAAVVAILRGNNETFAIKSGGHNPNDYWASVEGGPLISTKNFNKVIFDPATKTARIGPGLRWDEVAAALDGTGYSAVGGRIGNVGVGGYLLGGGLSFMSQEYGWAANSVLEYTIVLANSSIVRVTNSNYPDLFLSLRGGGNNYGIVTSFLVQVYPQGQVWGGNLIYTANDKNTPAILQAVRDFTEYNTDDKAAIIVTAEHTFGTLVNLWVIFMYYNGPNPGHAFDNFTAAKPFLNTGKPQSMSRLVSGNNWALIRGSAYTITTETLPNPPSGADGLAIMQNIHDTWRSISDQAALVPGAIASMAFQPVPRALARKALAKGGDLLDIPDDVDRLVIEFNYSYLLDAVDGPVMDRLTKETYQGMDALIGEYEVSGRLPRVYRPLFANDAYYSQDYFARLTPEMRGLAVRVRDEVDPGLWRGRTGGWKP